MHWSNTVCKTSYGISTPIPVFLDRGPSGEENSPVAQLFKTFSAFSLPCLQEPIILPQTETA